jgi:hypothetical protein
MNIWDLFVDDSCDIEIVTTEHEIKPQTIIDTDVDNTKQNKNYKEKSRKRRKETPQEITDDQKDKAKKMPPILSNNINDNGSPETPRLIHASNDYIRAPLKSLPSPSLFTKEMFPHDKQKPEENVPFIHNEIKQCSQSNPVTISQKECFGVNYLNPFNYPYIANILKVPPNEIIPMNTFSHKTFYRPVIESVPRKYDEDFLREPIGSERPCVRGNYCMGCKIPAPSGTKIILREYYLPSQYKICKESRWWPDDHTECLLCFLSAITSMFFNTKGDQMGIEDDSVIASFYHLVGIPGEYRLEDCISGTENRFMGIWGPIVIPKIYNYEYKIFEIKDPRGDIIKARGFEMRLGYPNESNTDFFQKGSLALKILVRSVHY